MIITTSFYNKAKGVEKVRAKELANIFKDEDITFTNLYAYFFKRYTPITFDNFTRSVRAILRTYGLSVDRVQMITYNFMPTRMQIIGELTRYSPENRIVLTYLMYAPNAIKMLIDGYRPSTVKIPKEVLESYTKLNFVKNTKLFISASAASGAMLKKYSMTIGYFRQFYMKMLDVKAILIKLTLYRFGNKT